MLNNLPTSVFVTNVTVGIDSVPKEGRFIENADRLLPDLWKGISSSIHGFSEQQFLFWLGALGVAGIIAFFVLFVYCKRGLQKFNLLPFFIYTFLYGVIVYDIGMFTGDNFSLITNLPMAILYGFKIFLLDSDVSELHEPFHESWLFSCNFALVHALAACITAMFLIKHFGFNLIAKIKLWKARFYWKRIKETYLFWGLNEQACQLIESIYENFRSKENNGFKHSGKWKKWFKKTNKDYQIIIVRTNNEDDDSREERVGINRIFDFLAIKSSELELIQHYGCLTTGTFANMSSIKRTGKGIQDILGKGLRLKSLSKLIGSKRARGNLHIFLLSNDTEENLEALLLLQNDKALNEFARNTQNGSKRELTFYCHGRKNSVHRVIEDCDMSDANKPSENIHVKVVDSSHLGVEMLMTDTNGTFLPVNFVKVEKDATVSTSFNALVIGFSEVGQDMVKFLYEFGAFVKTGSKDGKVERSDFLIEVLDKNMFNIAGPFWNNFTGKRNDKKGKDLITLRQMDCLSIDFFQTLKERINDLNYIVVSTEDDELNMATAVRVFKKAIQYRENLNDFCILVRIHDDEKGLYYKITEHYNKLWEAQVDSNVRRDKKAPELPLHIFGLDKNTYTFENIIDDRLLKEAVEYKENYAVSADGEKREDEWEKKHWFQDYRKYMKLDAKKDETGNEVYYYPTYEDLMHLRRNQQQDFSNSKHRITKLLLAKKAKEEIAQSGGIIPYKWDDLERHREEIEYYHDSRHIDPEKDSIGRILRVLAQTEHLRWNAACEMLGYLSKGEPGEKNELRMHHGSIVSWEDLKPDDRHYDCNVVDISLGIKIKDRRKK